MTVEDGAAVEWSSEVGAADWIVERLHPFASDVGSFVPEGLEAYARVLHPARRVEQGPELEPPLKGSLERDELDALVEILARHTGTPRSCWFGLWEGYGWMQGGRAMAELVPRPAHRWSRRRRRRPVAPVAPSGPRVQLPGRSLALHRGPIEAAAAFCRPPAFQSPNLWWPADRAWCVASDIDLPSTYVGGTRALVEEVLGDGRLEAVPARLTDPLHP